MEQLCMGLATGSPEQGRSLHQEPQASCPPLYPLFKILFEGLMHWGLNAAMALLLLIESDRLMSSCQ